LEFTPGSKFEYSNTNYVILGILIEKLSGQSYYDYTQSHILNPLGLSATEAGKSTITGEDYAKGYEYSSQSKEAEYIDMSIAYSAGVLSSNISDLEDWAASFINLSLISQQEYDEIFATETYGYGWLTKPIDGRNMFWHTGGINGFESVIMVLPDVNGVIIMLSNIENAKNGDISKYILDTQF
ncbi:MAG TPA: class A beta-lactamase-related serine hydrolase, partial [Hellea balneolensis]|nr:class A beta-lactamase-related serine hydrolase [Hellea balneolensis]